MTVGRSEVESADVGHSDQNGKPCAWSRIVTQRHWLNSSQLLCDPNRAPLPEAPVPPNVDLRDPELILKEAARTLDFSQPADVILAAVLGSSESTLLA